MHSSFPQISMFLLLLHLFQRLIQAGQMMSPDNRSTEVEVKEYSPEYGHEYDHMTAHEYGLSSCLYFTCGQEPGT